MISVITTVLNEGKTITKFLDSVQGQTLLPGEIIIVDGGSEDRTVELIKSHGLYKRKKIRAIVKRGNRSVGRNEAIKHAKGVIIACTDAGCILEKNWLKNITSPFKDRKIDVVGGFYKPYTRSVFEKSLATYTCVMPDRIDEKNFLPSSRSVAFKKIVWKKVGGYPEELDTCEDLVFDRKLKIAGFVFSFAKNAIVSWPQRKNITEAFWQFFNYAKGDGQAMYIRANTPFLFARYVFGLSLLIWYLKTGERNALLVILVGLLLYIPWSVIKNYRYVKDVRALVYLPSLQLMSDIAVITGMLFGFLKRARPVV